MERYGIEIQAALVMKDAFTLVMNGISPKLLKEK